MKEFVTYPSKKKREKSQDISKMKDDVIPKNPRELQFCQKKKVGRKIIIRKESQDIRLSNLPKDLL